MALTITDNNFEEIITTDKPVMIDFWAEWCGPCKMIGPIIEQISQERDDIVVGKVDVDNNPNLSFKYKIRSIPTIIIVKDGRVVARKVGGTSKANYENMLDDALIS